MSDCFKKILQTIKAYSLTAAIALTAIVVVLILIGGVALLGYGIFRLGCLINLF